MKIWQFFLFPFSVLYAMILRLRHLLYDMGVFKSYSFDIPVICIGNLSLGGTGKTPMTDLLISELSKSYRVGVVSRGYGRKTKGLVLADASSTPTNIGDEPFQLKRKFNQVTIAVDANRVNAINYLKNNYDLDLVVLDDAFQHRAVKATLNILLTTAIQPYFKDFLLPSGSLRDVVSARKRADIVVVTKIPKPFSTPMKSEFKTKLSLDTAQELFFAALDYSDDIKNETESIPLQKWRDEPFLLITGIANAVPLVNYLKNLGLTFRHMKFKDHHHYNQNDLEPLKNEKKILTTEKDYWKINSMLPQAYYLPVKHEILEGEKHFFQTIANKLGLD